MMAILDITIITVALPSIQRDLHFSTGNLAWVTTAYTLTFGSLMLFGGRTGDLFGRRRMFMTGVALFAAASLLGGLAQDPIWLILTRGLQGVGAAIASPTALSLIATNFAEGTPRNKALGVYASASAAANGIGVLAGGLLVNYVSWRWVLFVNVPIGTAVLFMAPRVLKEAEKIRGRLDVWGALTVTAGVASLIYGLTNASSRGWTSAATLGTFAGALILIVFFVALEARSSAPLMPLRIFANRNRSGTYLTMLLLGSMFSFLYFITLFFQDIEGYSPLRTGLYFLPFSIMTFVAAQLSFRLMGRLGPRVLVPGGTAVAAGGLFCLHTITVGTPSWAVLGPLLVMGFGLGTAFVPLTVGALSGVAPQEMGLTSGLLNAFEHIGITVGLAALSTIAVTTTNSTLRTLAISHHGVVSHHLAAMATTQGYDRAFTVLTAIVVGSSVVSLLAIKVGPRASRGGDH